MNNVLVRKPGVIILRLATEPHHIFKVGETATFVPKMEKARYFDRESEIAILPGPPGK